ncbi:MAG: IclR family transcriptional regulator [Deltaproteobacteria bacterium]|nr:MAG: IclR family transcriptional regulator [Deltaproteobacteria bacterium]
MIQSVDKAIGILSLFSFAHPRWGISDMAKAMGMPKGTLHNLVSTLAAAGFLQQDPETRRYNLGPKLFTLGSIMAGTLEINQKAAGPAHRVAAQTGLICRVAIWDRDAALITLNVAPQYTETLAPQIGPRVAAYCSAIGRMLLVGLDPREADSYVSALKPAAFTSRTIISKTDLKRELKETRLRGYALNNQEIAAGRASVAVAIFQKGGTPAAAMSLTGSPDQIFGKNEAGILSGLRATAAEISRYMGYVEAIA